VDGEIMGAVRRQLFGLLFIGNISKLKIIIRNQAHVCFSLSHSCQMAMKGAQISDGELEYQQFSGPTSTDVSYYTNQGYHRFLLGSV